MSRYSRKIRNLIKDEIKDMIMDYEDVYGSDLAYEIIQDECLDEDEIYDFLCKHADNEEVVRAYLIDMNWAIDKNTGIAIGFDDDVNVVNHEIE